MNATLNSRQIPQGLIDIGRAEIQELLNSVSGIDFVMLCSSDGFVSRFLNSFFA